MVILVKLRGDGPLALRYQVFDPQILLLFGLLFDTELSIFARFGCILVTLLRLNFQFVQKQKKKMWSYRSINIARYNVASNAHGVASGDLQPLARTLNPRGSMMMVRYSDNKLLYFHIMKHHQEGGDWDWVEKGECN